MCSFVIIVDYVSTAGHCWRSRDELISDVLLWTPSYVRAKAGRPARTYIQQLCEDTGCSPEDLPEAINDRESGERGSGISVLPVRHNDDDDDIYMYTYSCITAIQHYDEVNYRRYFHINYIILFFMWFITSFFIFKYIF